jgi:hypothetical protein
MSQQPAYPSLPQQPQVHQHQHQPQPQQPIQQFVVTVK